MPSASARWWRGWSCAIRRRCRALRPGRWSRSGASRARETISPSSACRARSGRPIRPIPDARDTLRPLLIRLRNDRRVALHHELPMRIDGAQRAFAAYVPIEPFVADQLEIGAAEAAVELVAADRDPGGVMKAAAGVDARRHDVEEARKGFADPRAGIVLVGDRIHAQLGDESGEFLRANASREPSTAPAPAHWVRPRR